MLTNSPFPAPAWPRSSLALTLPFLLLLAIDSWHHSLWADELHAWGLTVGSANLPELFQNLHYEGHPGLWHLLLWIPSRLSDQAAGMQLAAFAIGVAIILLIGLASPFSRMEKVLLLANYFIVWEYTAMARNYGIGLLLALLYAMVRRRFTDLDRRAALLSGLLLGLMANTNVYALFLSGFLALEFAWAGTFGAAVSPLAGLARILPGGTLYAALLVFSVWTFFPPPDIGHHAWPHGGAGEMARFAYEALRTLVAPFAPIDLSFPHSFAFPGNWFGGGKRVWIAAALLPLILAAQWTVLRHNKPMAAALVGTAAVATIFPFLIYPAAIRHMGVMFIGFVAAWWMVRDRMPARSWPVLGLLALGAIGGATAVAGQWMRPFAVNDQAAAWLRQNQTGAMLIAGDDDMRIEPVAILSHRPFISLDCLCEDRFVRFLDRRDGYDLSMAPGRLRQIAGRLGPAPFLLLAESRWDETRRAAMDAQGLHLTELAYFSGAERDKQIAIYRVEAKQR